MTAHKVTQDDRELFKLLFDYGRPQVGAYVDAGKLDQAHDMQAIAAHRIAVEQSRDDVIEEYPKVDEQWDENSPHNSRAQAIRATKGSKT